MNLRIYLEEQERGIENVLSFVRKQEQYYPLFDEWVYGKLKDRLLDNRYKALVGLDYGDISGCLIYDVLDDQVSIKNFRIDKNYQHRMLGQFLIRQLESFNKPLTTDITISNFSGVQFFLRNGFDIQTIEELYIPNQYEYIIRKEAV